MIRKILIFVPLLLFAYCSTREPERKPEPIIRDTITVVEQKFQVPDTATLKNDEWGSSVKYGMRLIKNTAYYIGPEGKVSHNLRNKMNCTNCHLDNGTKPFGLNFFDSHRTYPQYRAREDKILSMSERVNNCIERPHNGIPLPLDSKEMTAIVSYIKWLGEGYDKDKHEGYGLKYIETGNMKADSKRGAIVYDTHCKSCHQTDGQGQMNAEKTTYTYPPLWGKYSYQEGSSMHRVIKAASFIRANMPNLKTSHDKPTLSDQEALDVAAFINDGSIHERPKSKYYCYPNTETKPIDFFEGPYLDSFPQATHTFGPWDEIERFYIGKGLKVYK
jgi:thiosulfate dehydrogenase